MYTYGASREAASHICFNIFTAEGVGLMVQRLYKILYWFIVFNNNNKRKKRKKKHLKSIREFKWTDDYLRRYVWFTEMYSCGLFFSSLECVRTYYTNLLFTINRFSKSHRLSFDKRSSGLHWRQSTFAERKKKLTSWKRCNRKKIFFKDYITIQKWKSTWRKCFLRNRIL